MNTQKRGSTSEMQVISIRLEAELKEQLREIAGEQGYQTLIRDVLWQFVEQQVELDEVSSYSAEDRRSPSHSLRLSMSDIRATFRALAKLSEGIAQQEEQCAVTGRCIQPHQEMLVGLTRVERLLPSVSRSLHSTFRSCKMNLGDLCLDLSNILCQGQICSGNLPSNSMAERLRASFHSRIGIVHFFERLPIAKYTTFNTASSFGETR